MPKITTALIVVLSLLVLVLSYALARAADPTQQAPTIDPRVLEMYQGAQRAVMENDSTNWQRAYVASLNQLNDDWKKSFDAWCGKRPACGLQPKVTKPNDIPGPGRVNNQSERPNPGGMAAHPGYTGR